MLYPDSLHSSPLHDFQLRVTSDFLHLLLLHEKVWNSVCSSAVCLDPEHSSPLHCIHKEPFRPRVTNKFLYPSVTARVCCRNGVKEAELFLGMKEVVLLSEWGSCSDFLFSCAPPMSHPCTEEGAMDPSRTTWMAQEMLATSSLTVGPHEELTSVPGWVLAHSGDHKLTETVSANQVQMWAPRGALLWGRKKLNVQHK